MPLPETFTGSEFRERVAPDAGVIIGLLEQLMTTTGTFDALLQNQAARTDPTIPALLNSQLQRFAEQQNTGGFDANAFLSGDFSRAAPANPTTLGAGTGSPFDIPFQEAGSNPIIDFLINSVIGPITVDSLQGIRDILFQAGGPIVTAGTNRDDPGSNISQEGTLQDLLDRFTNIQGGGGEQSLAPVPAPPPGPPSPPSASGVPAPAGPNRIEELLQLRGRPQVAQGSASGATTPILGSFAQGGTVPQTGAFILEQGEQVIPNTGQPKSPSVPALTQSRFSRRGGDPPPASVVPGLGFGADDPNAIARVAGDIPPPQDVAEGVPNVAPPPPSPLQQAIDSLLGLVQGGGPLQQNINDNFASQLQSSRRSVSEDFGRRGLGGSGIEEQLQLQGELGIQGNAIRASNDLALSGAQALGGLSLGAGQFGLQQQQLEFQQNQSLFESLLRAIQGNFANPGENQVQTINVI